MMLSQVGYNAWVWENKVHKVDLFTDLKVLLRFHDGRVPKKLRTRCDVMRSDA